MTRMIEVVYEDEVLKPLTPIDGLKKHERVWVIFCPHLKKNLYMNWLGP